MKKIIALLLALTLCVGLFAGCKKDEPETPTVQDAMDYLVNSYRDDEGKKTPADYKMPAQVPIGEVKFPVTWESSLDTIEIVLEDGLYTVKVPSKNDAEVEYTLTATVKDEQGNSLTKEFKRVLPVYDNAASVTEPEEGVAYKLYMVQANAGKTVFALGEMQGEKYIKTDIDPKKGVDFYAEKVDGGYKFYTEIGGVKNYVHAHTTTGEDGKVSKYIGFATESDCVYYYVSAVKAWFVKVENIEYVVGTYSDYTTICISESTYISADNTGVSQFPVALMEKEAAEALAPSEGPKDPTELSAIKDLLDKANALENSAQTPEKYLVQGVITEIKSEQYGNMYIKDEAGNELYIYGVYSKDGADRYDAMNPQPKVGDTVTLMGVLSKYNDAPQMKNAWVQELVPGEGGDAPAGPTDKPSTPAAIVDAAYALEGGATLAGGPYTLTGKIISIDTEWSEQYGNISVSIVVDGKEDKPIQAFRLKGDGAANLKVGDVITVTGQLLNYVNKDGKSKIEFDAGCTLDKVSAGETPVDPPVDNDPTDSTVADILNAAFALKDGEALENPVKLTGVVTKLSDINEKYGDRNVNFTVEGKDIYCYALKGDVAKIQVGDTITVEGIIKNYKGTVEFDKAQLISGGTGTGSTGGNTGSTGGNTGSTGGNTGSNTEAASPNASVVVDGTKWYMTQYDGKNNAAVEASTNGGEAGQVTVTFSADGKTATIKVGGTFIAPKGGNTNGITEGEYAWAVVKNADGTCKFMGQGEDTVTLCLNIYQSYNKFRAYKNSNLEQHPESYYCNFVLG